MARNPGEEEPRPDPTPALRLDLVRQEKGITLQQIAAATRISIWYLRAIERQEFGKLPGGIFNTSYLRQYAACVGLEQQEVLALYERYMANRRDEAENTMTRFAAAGKAEFKTEDRQPDMHETETAPEEIQAKNEEAPVMENSDIQPSRTMIENLLSDSKTTEQMAHLLNTKHWLKSYIVALLNAHQAADGVDFNSAEQLLQRERSAFEADLDIARRMHEIYPHLFQQRAAGA